MAQVDHKHPTMTLYVAQDSPITHWISLILAEKIVIPNIVFVDPKEIPPTLSRVNPQGILPFLIDQENLMLYSPIIIAEYLEERFPHPPLLPIYPIMRAKYRQVILQILQDWYTWLRHVESNQQSEQALSLLKQGLSKISPVFESTPYFLSDEFTLVDCCIAPVLTTLKKHDIDIISSIRSLAEYQKRLFKRDTFKSSLHQLDRHVEFDHADL